VITTALRILPPFGAVLLPFEMLAGKRRIGRYDACCDVAGAARLLVAWLSAAWHWPGAEEGLGLARW
jgi:hypothetical protein